MKLIDYLYMTASWSVFATIKLLLVVTGFPIVAIGCSFPKKHPETKRLFSQYFTDQYWMLVTMPKIFWLWDNARDGSMGDTRGWYKRYAQERGWSEWFSRYHWLAIRNPCNNIRFIRGLAAYMPDVVVSVIKGQDYVDDSVGNEGFQILKGKGKYFNYYTLYYVAKANDDGISPLVIRLGHKIKMSHNDTDWTPELNANDGRAFKGYKGMTFRIKFNKKIS